ncbi:MAG: type IX secretion system membrane protein PorP/SprF [Bacteroidales bacterium]|nr:type IX secretion system membrane protein PorP/SprF [Bacteroidales bacterium]MBN2818837.1 type IX secretion system membrane protein PorP/SprF [Bacteroidales bacterium]
MLKKSVIILFLFVCLKQGWSQQFPSYTNYSMNKFIYNPAVAGSEGYTSINLIAREQWVGFKGTPKTHAITIDSRILGNSFILSKLSVRKKKPRKTKSGNTGWGAYLFNDLNGPIDKTGVNGTYSHHISLGNSQLSFGLGISLFQLKIQGDQFIFADDTPDDILTGKKQSIWITDANFGVYYTSRSLYGGYSTMQLFNSSGQFGKNAEGEYKLVRQHNLVGGYNIGVTRNLEIEPSFLLKIPEKSGAQFDLNAKCVYDGMYWGGLGFRTGSALSVFGGVIIENYYIGYAFDYNFGSIHKTNFGSHEFVFSMRIGDTARRYKWLNTY